MQLRPGDKLGPYEISAKIGAGGMGEVYRATDVKLNRDVALKVLPPRLAEDEERLARFKREAQTLAALNHPNIAQIYGLQDNALVMEYVPGPDLRGPLPLETAMRLACQIAEALEYAHDKGIVHRDLKPANIKVTPEGQIKVLDFGLAKAIAQESVSRDPGPVDFSDPALNVAATMKGAILGTPGYMSPEQARGETVDRRADIWAFGAVLFEMLAGKRLINAPSVSDALAAVLKSNLSLTALPAETPPAVHRLIERCLTRDPKRRLQAIGEARIILDPREDASTLMIGAEPSRRSSRLGWMAAALSTLAFAGVSVVAWRATRPPVPPPLMRFNSEVGPDAALARSNSNGILALSPDGTRLAIVYQGADGESRLGTRFLYQSAILPLTNTEGAHTPFFSPDGEWIAFFAQGKIKKISVHDGAVATICEAPNVRGVSWGDDGNIVLAPGSGSALSRVSANGGTLAPLTKLKEGERTHRWPQVLPGSKAVLFTAHTSTGVYNDATIEAQSLVTGERKIVVRGGFFGQYLPSGHLIYLHDSTLFAAPFDPERLTLTGTPAAILEDINANSTSGGDFAFSRNGIFVYLAGKSASAGSPITWLDSAGARQLLYAPTGLCFTPRFSPDGKHLAFAMNSGQQDDIWVKDLDRGSPYRLTFRAGSNRCPVWTPDGQYIVFRSLDPKSPGIYWIRADGSGQPERLTDGKLQETPYSFSPDGKLLAFQRAGDNGNGPQDILIVPLEGDPAHPRLGKEEPFLNVPFSKGSPVFSPDGHWLAYSSTESGTSEVYVRPFPGPGRKTQISTGGGRFPMWSRNGHELLFRKPSEGLQAVKYAVKGDTFTASTPRVWSSVPLREDSGFPSYDLAPDGKRIATFLAAEEKEAQKPLTHLVFLLNFFNELRKKAPGKN